MAYTELYLHDVEDIDISDLHHLEEVNCYSRNLVVKDTEGGKVSITLISKSPSSLIFLDDLVIGEKK